MSKRLFYINLPSRLSDQLKEFPLDCAIPLPVEVSEEKQDSWDISQIEWPAIVSGLIYELSLHPEGPRSDYYRRLVRVIQPGIIPIILTTAELKLNQRDYPFAEELFKSLCALEPENPLHKANLALFYQKKEDQELQSNQLYQRALELLRQNKPQEGMGAIKTFLNGNPQSGNGWFLLGWAMRQQEKWEEALGAFMTSSRYSPPSAEMHNEISLCLSELGEFDKSIDALNEGLKLDPHNTTLLSNLAMVYLRMNDLSHAEDTMNLLKEMDPEDPLVNRFF